MKQPVYQIGAVLVLSALLAACNTDTEELKSTAAVENEPETEQAENEQQQDSADTSNTTAATAEITEEQPEEQPASVQTETEEDTALTYTSNGQPFTEKAVTTASEEMNYTIQHLENYTLIAEEPGVDQLLYNADNSLSMQIEVANKEDITFDALHASAKETIAAIAPENVKELNLEKISAERDEILNIAGYEALLDEEKVVMVVFERDSLIVTLTIYDLVQADLMDAFLQMGLTIKTQ